MQKVAASLSRKRRGRPARSAVAMLPSGVSASKRDLLGDLGPQVHGCRGVAGQMPLTRMPRYAHSMARHFVRCATAALEAL